VSFEGVPVPVDPAIVDVAVAQFEEGVPPVDLDSWLKQAKLEKYTSAIKEYGYDSMDALLAASTEEIDEMTKDPDVKMKKPHQKLMLTQWKKLVGTGALVNVTGGSPKPASSAPSTPEVAAHGLPTRMSTDTEVALSMLPTTKWTEVAPVQGCLAVLCTSVAIRSTVPDIDAIAEDVRMKVMELQFTPVPVKLPDDCMAAIVTYTHDLQRPQKKGNVYFELNQMLRQRGVEQRAELMQTWGSYMYYMMTGLEMLPDFEGTCWRGYNHGTREEIIEEYKVGRPIQVSVHSSRFPVLPRVHSKLALKTSTRHHSAPYCFYWRCTVYPYICDVAC